jgi:nitroreductase
MTASVAALLFVLTKKSQSVEKKWVAEELIASRRSIFPQNYDPSRVVPKHIIEKMLESANWAPTHGRTEPWRFIVFASAEARQRLGEFDAELYKKMTLVDFVVSKYKKKIKNKEQASYVIAICMKRQESGKIPEVEEIASVACAVQNMHLTATAYGVGAYWSSGAQVYSDEMKDFLGLGEKDRCLGFFYVGYPYGKIPKGVRKSISDKVQWITA